MKKENQQEIYITIEPNNCLEILYTKWYIYFCMFVCLYTYVCGIVFVVYFY